MATQRKSKPRIRPSGPNYGPCYLWWGDTASPAGGVVFAKRNLARTYATSNLFLGVYYWMTDSKKSGRVLSRGVVGSYYEVIKPEKK